MGSIHWMVEKGFLLKPLSYLPGAVSAHSIHKPRLLILFFPTHYAPSGSISAFSLFWTQAFTFFFLYNLTLSTLISRCTMDVTNTGFWIMVDYTKPSLSYCGCRLACYLLRHRVCVDTNFAMEFDPHFERAHDCRADEESRRLRKNTSSFLGVILSRQRKRRMEQKETG
jgi:hypothetical protein